jgi:hypothetical protein
MHNDVGHRPKVPFEDGECLRGTGGIPLSRFVRRVGPGQRVCGGVDRETDDSSAEDQP